ncbi:MAG: hypothetical protein IKX95_00970 [Lachnospiraceae bacterium]|nr:hypothetical protein [Lachnospiraceae bacterium]
MNPVALGFVTGLMIAVILLVFIFKYVNKDHKLKTEYDERQKAVRGKAYKYAFYTELAAQAVVMWLLMAEIELPIENYALLFTAMMVGCTVLAVYCVWNDVYWGLNSNRKRYNGILIAAVILNALPVVANAMAGTLTENGKIGMPLLNIVVLVMMAIIFVEFLIKKGWDEKADEEV